MLPAAVHDEMGEGSAHTHLKTSAIIWNTSYFKYYHRANILPKTRLVTNWMIFCPVIHIFVFKQILVLNLKVALQAFRVDFRLVTKFIKREMFYL